MKYVIGDVHGTLFTLQDLLNKINSLDNDANFIYLGDYVDRGRFSKETVDFLITLNPEKNIFLRGNHDDVFNYILNGFAQSDLTEYLSKKLNDTNAVMWALNCQSVGFPETLKSYGIDYVNEDYQEVLKKIRSSVPDHHKMFFKNLKLYWENDKFFACHAYFDPRISLPRDLKFVNTEGRHKMIWTRFSEEEIFSANHKWDKVGIFGHSPVQYFKQSAAFKSGKIIMIDTGASLGTGLTAYCIEKDDFITVESNKKDLVEKWVKL